MKNALIIDVEATGGSAMTHSMIQLGCVDLLGNEFYAELRPLEGRKIDPNAMNAIGLTIDQVGVYPIASEGMIKFSNWLERTYKGKRVPVWSDNPAFDWQFVNGYMFKFVGHNPMGFSMRRIGDFYAGLKKDVYAATKWKRLRDTKHTHNALDDARGNAEALKKILEMGR